MIDKIVAKNFKSFKDLSLGLRPLTVLCGTNGSGKSSVMQLLLLLKENARAGIGDIDAKLNSYFINLGRQKDVLYRWADAERKCSFEIESRDGRYASCADMLDSTSDYDFIALHSSVENNQGLATWLNKDIRYLSADRLPPHTHHEFFKYEIIARHVGRKGENAVAILYDMGDEEVPEALCHDSSGDATLKGQVNAWLKDVSFGVSLSTEQAGDQVNLQVNYGGAKLGKGFRPENVGFGISYVLPVLVMILTARKGECLLIENPGAHLHPQGQAQLGRLIAKAAAYGIQIIIETHSDHVVNGIRVGCKKRADEHPEECAADGDATYYGGVIINFFERVAESSDELAAQYSKVTPIRIESNGELECYPEGFLDEWPNQMGELA